MKRALPALLLAASSLALAQQPDRLATRPGIEIGGQISAYDYREPYLPPPTSLVEIKGNRLGLVGAWTAVSDRVALAPLVGTTEEGLPPLAGIARVDARASYGSLDYHGSGSSTGIPDLILEARAVVGFDWILRSVTLSPYTGLGYRYLYDDLSGYSSTGAVGYRRYSNYFYAPLGMTLRVGLDANWVFAPTAEYDFFIQGKQKSMLSDVNAAFANVTNTQNKGYGYRLALMFERDKLAVGPYLHYWHIQDSDIQPIGGGLFGLEPENYTREYGLELRYRF